MTRKRRPRRDAEAELAAELAETCAGLSPLESALLIVDGMRQVYGGKWAIEASADGSFAICRQAD